MLDQECEELNDHCTHAYDHPLAQYVEALQCCRCNTVFVKLGI